MAAQGHRSTQERGDPVLLSEIANLEAMVMMRSHLQANIAHELRTPLAAARGYLKMVLDERAGPVSDRQREFLEVAVSNTNKLIDLVAWMSRIAQTAEEKMNLTAFDLRDLWRTCLSEKSIAIEESFGAAVFPVIADRDKIREAFEGLLLIGIQHAGAVPLLFEMSGTRDGGVNVKLARIKGEVTEDLRSIHDIVALHGGRFFHLSDDGNSSLIFMLPAVKQASH